MPNPFLDELNIVALIKCELQIVVKFLFKHVVSLENSRKLKIVVLKK